MPEPILDFHTHAQNVFGMCCVPPSLQPLAKNGLARLYEKTGFHPLVKKAESPLSRQFIVREVQSRFASFTFADYLAAMERNGVTHACALPVEPMAGTAELLQLAKDHPQVIPFASILFDEGDPAKQLERHIQAGCKGLKLHPIMQHIEPDDERIHALFRFLRGSRFPVLFHTGRMHYFLGRRREDPAMAEPERIVPLLKAFPEQPVVFGHMGLLDAEPAIRIAKAFPNVYLETSFQPVAMVRKAIHEIGPDRILMGSDWPATEAATEIGIVRKAVGNDKEAERKILFGNGMQLLQLPT
jgi:uncharacterized protein